MTTLSTFLSFEMFFLLGALAATIGYRLLTRQMNIDGLLANKSSKREDRSSRESEDYDVVISPGRIQMLITTLLVTIYVLMKVVQTQKFPNIPQQILLAFGGSHVLYLGGKVYSMLTEKLANAASELVKKSKQ